MSASYGSHPPAGTRKQGMAIASLVIGLLAIPSLGCLLVGALLAIVLGIVALVRANREPETYGGAGLAIGGIVAAAFSLLVAIPLGGIVAAIAIPSLLRARVSANEAAAIGDLRTIISAEAAYQSASGGVYGPPECLAAPADCIQGYTGPVFVDPALASSAVKGGYRRNFHPGPPAGAGGRGLESYAMVLTPETLNRTGTRSFCGDATGRICSATTESLTAAGGACPPEPMCSDLR